IERRRARPENLFKRIVATAFAPPGETTQAERWERLLRDVFNPLEVAPEPDNIGEVTIALDGLRLSVPGVGAASALRLEYADGGRRLFSPRDAALASELTAMLRYALESKAAHERGVAEERGRIARDLHDTIGARLLSALHQPDREEKDGRIREAMADLRLIINNAVQSGETLEEALAELRQETAERLANVGVSLEWVSESEDAPRLDYRILHTVRTVAREAVSNIIRHAEARNVRLSIVWSDGNLRMTVLDDGKGFDSATCRRRHGLQNMRK